MADRGAGAGGDDVVQNDENSEPAAKKARTDVLRVLTRARSPGIGVLCDAPETSPGACSFEPDIACLGRGSVAAHALARELLAAGEEGRTRDRSSA